MVNLNNVKGGENSYLVRNNFIYGLEIGSIGLTGLNIINENSSNITLANNSVFTNTGNNLGASFI